MTNDQKVAVITGGSRGAISFAMNVAEILRALELLEKYQY